MSAPYGVCNSLARGRAFLILFGEAPAAPARGRYTPRCTLTRNRVIFSNNTSVLALGSFGFIRVAPTGGGATDCVRGSRRERDPLLRSIKYQDVPLAPWSLVALRNASTRHGSGPAQVGYLVPRGVYPRRRAALQSPKANIGPTDDDSLRPRTLLVSPHLYPKRCRNGAET